MRCLNTITVLLFMLLCVSTTAQTNTDSPVCNITVANEASYYKKANKLLSYAGNDSLFAAYRIFLHLSYFDSIKYSKKKLAPAYLAIETINRNTIKKNIVGRWKLEWGGSNRGAYKDYIGTNKKLILTDTEAFFYNGDTLTRRTAYSITNECSPILKEFSFLIVFADNKTKNEIYLKNSGADYSAHLKFSRDNIALYLSSPGFCNDCGYIIYMKDTASNYRLE